MLEMNSPIRNASKTTTNNTFKETLKKEAFERKKNILHLIFKYLTENHLYSVAELLQNETQTGLFYQACDNIDLEIILQEYQSYYYAKFQKNPKILRKITENEQVKPKKEKKSASKEKVSKVEQDDHQLFNFQIMSISQEETPAKSAKYTKPLTDFENYSPEWREIAEQVTKQIIPKNLDITFKDCIGLETTIETIKEAIIYPLKYPSLFEKACCWKGVLLYGPPGTGKTLLAKALACESPSTFINVTSSAFISKWRGESEKMLKVLFDVAKFYAPTTIFIDEIDALASTTQDHEASRRFKSELLVQIDGIVKTEEIFVLASTNHPWNIDSALLRRFEKRVMVPLPDKDARREIFQWYFTKHGHGGFKNEEMDMFVNLSEHFSGSDINTVCKELEMVIVREKLRGLIKGNNKNVIRTVKSEDVLNSLKKIKPCISSNDYKRFIDWETKYGAL